jgi:dTDP-glucose 4,6-dehydratase
LPTVLLTGAGSFIGHHVLEHILVNTDWDVTGTDSFRHKGKTDRVAEVLDKHPDWRARVTIITHDLAAPFSRQTVAALPWIDYVIALASLSHVDTSIEDPVPFVQNNVQVALNTLELCREIQPASVILISTDEVYGPVEKGHAHPEWAPVLPSNPYAGSKACQEALAISWWRTYGVPVILTNIMNATSERQDPVKYVPMLIGKISRGETVRIHGRPGDIGSRHYIHARNIADALVFILRNLPPAAFPAHLKELERNGQVRGLPPWRTADRPDRYNIAGDEPTDNLELAQMVADIIGEPLRYELVDFHAARPGHDPHYGLSMAKLAGLGWKPPVSFRESLEHTVRWTLANPRWLLDD